MYSIDWKLYSLCLIYYQIKILFCSVWEIAVHLTVAGDVFYGVFVVLSFFPRDVLVENWDLIESDSEGFPTYS